MKMYAHTPLSGPLPLYVDDPPGPAAATASLLYTKGHFIKWCII